ncbi:MAG TPA: helix-turn-helix domain-containing protein, partial [Bellilinea sp.]|nr:helix-turn-helix domain-containing protein [Bellilinea sp.]
RGRQGGRKRKMTPAKIKLARAALKDPTTQVNALCKELGITRLTLYRHLSPQGDLRQDGQKTLRKRN